MRFELQRLANYSDDAILAELRRVAEVVEKPTLSVKDFDKHSRVSPSTVRRRFGSWRLALRAADLANRFDASNKCISPEEAVVELQRVSEVLGAQGLTRDAFNANARFKDDAVRRVFGSWRNAMRAAGLQINPLGKRYSDDECFENLLSVWTHHGRAPKYEEMKLPPSIVGPKAYISRFGTWTKALHAFVDRANADIALATELTSPKVRKKPNHSASGLGENDKREIRLGLRYSVLKRDSFRCVTCGRSPATDVGVILHIDHLVPVARGGKTSLENLRALCAACNLGKGSTIEDANSRLDR